MQQLSIARLIIWLYDNQRCGQTSANAIPDQHRYQEAISRMQTPKPADQKGSYKRNLDVLIDRIFSANSLFQIEKWPHL